jgi:hypothetical protein
MSRPINLYIWRALRSMRRGPLSTINPVCDKKLYLKISKQTSIGSINCSNNYCHFVIYHNIPVISAPCTISIKCSRVLKARQPKHKTNLTCAHSLDIMVYEMWIIKQLYSCQGKTCPWSNFRLQNAKCKFWHFKQDHTLNVYNFFLHL